MIHTWRLGFQNYAASRHSISAIDQREGDTSGATYAEPISGQVVTVKPQWNYKRWCCSKYINPCYSRSLRRSGCYIQCRHLQQWSTSKRAKKDVAFTLNNFQLGKAAITPEIKKILEKSIGILLQYPEMKIYSTGYTCDKGASAINAKVNKQRAETVRNYMVKAGIDASRITIQSEGEKILLCPIQVRATEN